MPHQPDYSLNSNQTFENFVCSEHNAAAYGFATAVSLSYQSERNPLLICGPKEGGKTHLINAIANQWRRFEPRGKIQRIAASAFLDPQQLDPGLVTLDILLIDGLESIAGNDIAQDLLLITCETLRIRGKQTVLTIQSDTNHLPGIHEKVVQFLNSGISVMVRT